MCFKIDPKAKRPQRDPYTVLSTVELAVILLIVGLAIMFPFWVATP